MLHLWAGYARTRVCLSDRLGYQYFLVLLSGEVTMMDMDLTQLSSRVFGGYWSALGKKGDPGCPA